MFKKRGLFYRDDFEIVKEFCKENEIENILLVMYCMDHEIMYIYTEKPKKINDIEIGTNSELKPDILRGKKEIFFIFWEKNIELKIDVSKYTFEKISDIEILREKSILYSEQFINCNQVEKGSNIFSNIKLKMDKELKEKDEDVFFNILLKKSFEITKPIKENLQFINNLNKFKKGKNVNIFNESIPFAESQKNKSNYFMEQVKNIEKLNVKSIIENDLNVFKKYLYFNSDVNQYYIYVKIIKGIKDYLEHFQITQLRKKLRKKSILKSESELLKDQLSKIDRENLKDIEDKIRIEACSFFKTPTESDGKSVVKILNFNSKANIEFFSIATYNIENHIDRQSESLNLTKNEEIKKNIIHLLSKSQILLDKIETNIKKYREIDKFGELDSFQDYKILLKDNNEYTRCNIEYNNMDIIGYKFILKTLIEVIDKKVSCLFENDGEVSIVKFIKNDEKVEIKGGVKTKVELTMGSLVKVVTELKIRRNYHNQNISLF